MLYCVIVPLFKTVNMICVKIFINERSLPLKMAYLILKMLTFCTHFSQPLLKNIMLYFRHFAIILCYHTASNLLRNNNNLSNKFSMYYYHFEKYALTFRIYLGHVVQVDKSRTIASYTIWQRKRSDDRKCIIIWVMFKIKSIELKS